MKTGVLKDYHGELILGDIDTSNILLLNVLYHRPTKATKWKDYASIVVKDVTTNEKRLITIEEPPMILYYIKEEYRDYTYYPAYKPLSQVETKKIAYKDVIKEIGEVAGKNGAEFLAQCKRSNPKAAKNIHKYPYVLGTDYDYPSLFRIEWMLHYHNPNIVKKVSKIYLDIEVDSIEVPGFPGPGSCPINAISLIDPDGKSVYVFLLNNFDNPLIAEFSRNIKGFEKKLHDAFDETYGEFDYQIFMYDEEIVLIQQCFALINNLKRDFCMIWNMRFDIPFIIARIQELGFDPKEIMCDSEFVVKECYYRKDTFHYDFKTRNDSFTLSSQTVFLDQMAQYIKIRKAKGELRSVKLNIIAQQELGDEKLDYSEIANIKTFPYVDYEKFVMYNIKDSLLLYGIEEKTHDIDNVFDRALSNATQYQSIFSQTLLLKNRAYLSYFKQGFIIGNNRNIDYSVDKRNDDEEKFGGALVVDPSLNANVGAIIFGKPSKWIFRLVIDLDLTNKVGTPVMVYAVVT